MKLNYPKNQAAADKLIHVISSCEEALLYRIPVYALGKKLNISRTEIISMFIHGVYDGIFVLNWIYHCPHCGGIAHETLSIHKATSENFCEACNASFTNTLDDNIEAVFSIHPQIRQFPDALKAQYVQKITDDVNKGLYRTWLNDDVIRGSDIIQNSAYRELMGTDVLLEDQSLQLMKVTILFTDIRGSTQMYTDLGDAKAFSLVKEHFAILFETVKRYEGVPVKTIGDAIMGVFVDPEKAVIAALEAQKQIIASFKTKPEKEHIQVKIGVHTGPALVVTLNGKLDYFGSTVNLAARIQGAAAPNEVLISEELFTDTAIQRIISRVTRTVQKQQLPFKGLEGKHTIYRIRVPENGV